MPQLVVQELLREVKAKQCKHQIVVLRNKSALNIEVFLVFSFQNLTFIEIGIDFDLRMH
jgi:hypothetical protein